MAECVHNLKWVRRGGSVKQECTLCGVVANEDSVASKLVVKPDLLAAGVDFADLVSQIR
jgi:hypothetical protein